MDLYTLQNVLAIADNGSLSLAAQACHLGQPALTQQLAKLEKELGVKLFFRHARGMTLTEAGETFVRRAREIIQMADALQAEMAGFAGVRRGTLNLGIITSLQCIDFGGMLSAFCGSYPEISLNICQGGTHGLIGLLLERKIDIAFCNMPLEGIPPELKFLSLGADTYSLAVPSIHPLADRDVVSLKELKGQKFIFHQEEQAAAQLCLAACRAAGFEPEIVCRSGDPTAGLYMVRGGLGVALFPSEEFRNRSIDNVREVKLKERIVKEVGAVWRQNEVSPLVEAATSFASSWVRR